MLVPIRMVQGRFNADFNTKSRIGFWVCTAIAIRYYVSMETLSIQPLLVSGHLGSMNGNWPMSACYFRFWLTLWNTVLPLHISHYFAHLIHYNTFYAYDWPWNTIIRLETAQSSHLNCTPNIGASWPKKISPSFLRKVGVLCGICLMHTLLFELLDSC